MRRCTSGGRVVSMSYAFRGCGARLRLVDRSLWLGSLSHQYWTGHVELPWRLLWLQSSVVFLLPVLTLNGGRCVGQSEAMSP